MNIDKEAYNELALDARRYKFLKYEATPAQWENIGNVDSVEEIDEIVDLLISRMWKEN